MATSAKKWRRRAEARPDEILDAAMLEFDARGFLSTRIDDIAQRAGLSKGAVYLYFESKEALLYALIEREVTPVVHRLETVAKAETSDPEAALKMVVSGLEHAIHETDLFRIPRIVLSVAAQFPDIAEYYRKNVVERAFHAIGAIYLRGVASGRFIDIEPNCAARLIIGPVFVEAMRVRLLRGDPEKLSTATRAEIQLDALMAGLRTRAA